MKNLTDYGKKSMTRN